MTRRHGMFLVLGAGLMTLGGLMVHEAKGQKKADTRVFEMRTYYAGPGKMEGLHKRFRDHTCKLLEKHGATPIGFWNPIDADGAQKKLVWIVAFPSKEAADKIWAAFRKDPDWIKAKDASEVNGKLVEKIESVYLNPADYSPIK